MVGKVRIHRTPLISIHFEPFEELRRSCFAEWQQAAGELRSDSVAGQAGAGTLKTALQTTGLAAQLELRPPTGCKYPETQLAGREPPVNTALRWR
ncbi:MAG: hypothetical protein ACKPJD_28580, partial [Planctomycetaceae bacterium]